MARIRSIKPELRTSITVSMWPREVRYFFVLLWGYLDDYGRGVDDELLVAADCFPRDRDITPDRIDAWLEMIADSGPVCRYEVDGRRYLHAVNWSEHQKPSHPGKSKIPPCPDDEPDDFKKWREANPQRLANRSRKSREGFQKIPEDVPGPSREPSGTPSGPPFGELEHDNTVIDLESYVRDTEAEEPAGHDTSRNSPEPLASTSGDSPETFTPEQGAGSREQGAGGCGGNGRRDSAPNPTPARRRPDGLTTIPDDFYLNDTMRRWSIKTFGNALDPEFETQQFISYWRGEGRRKSNWHEAWQKWMRDSARRKSERAHLRPASGQTPEERGIF